MHVHLHNVRSVKSFSTPADTVYSPIEVTQSHQSPLQECPFRHHSWACRWYWWDILRVSDLSQEASLESHEPKSATISLVKYLSLPNSVECYGAWVASSSGRYSQGGTGHPLVHIVQNLGREFYFHLLQPLPDRDSNPGPPNHWRLRTSGLTIVWSIRSSAKYSIILYRFVIAMSDLKGPPRNRLYLSFGISYACGTSCIR